MKKNYFMLAAATMMLAACAETGLVDELVVEETQQAIEFDAFTNKASRSEIASAEDLQNTNGGFNVWGYKTNGNVEYTVFSGDEVFWVAAAGDVSAHWDYTDTKYWDQKATYAFYAVAPKAVPNTTEYAIDPTTKLVTITGAQPGVDYLIDRDGTTGISGSTKDAVELNFDHIKSKISFKLKAGVAEKIIVTSLVMYGYDGATAAKFVQVDSPSDNEEWTITETNPITENTAVSIIDANSDSDDVTLTSDQAVSDLLTTSFIMVPQTITYTAKTQAAAESGLTFKISYKIAHTANDVETFTDQIGIVKTTQSWNTNSHITYIISVKPDAIEFGDPEIKDWSTSEPTAELPL